ncbi:MAG: type II toxin-antitoxin system VapC family toxin [Candidatus Caenarcaniphilales bacterium]|nr:type II toxin-antitoxin system VapC family toxin [Candidatus Caenarcaniphilales bacterium]
MVKKADKKVFIDTNILVYSTNHDSPFKSQSDKLLRELLLSEITIFINLQVIREYLVVSSRDSIQGMSPILKNILAFKSVFNILEDSEESFSKLLFLVEKYNVKGKQIHDANIVACMLSNGVNTIVTNNEKDFERFKDLIEIIPLAA